MTDLYIRTDISDLPDARGYFGEFGGRFVPETIMPALDELERAYAEAIADPQFQADLRHLQRTYTGRPTPITHARRLSEALGGAQIYLKREDLAHTGAHKINNALGQGLLAKRMGKRRIIAETGAVGSTAWERRPPWRCLAWSAMSIWAASISAGSSRMYSV